MTMHAPLVSEQVAFQVSHSQAKGIIVSGEVQARKVFDVLDQLPDLIITDENGGMSKVIIANVQQSNGVIHVIDKVLLPKM